VVALNRAVAVGMAVGPAEGLAALEAIPKRSALESYHLLPAVRADFLEKLGRLTEARAEFEHAAALTRNEAERDVLKRRAAMLAVEGGNA
jgi:predicted RNA polymerase sigma factor